MEIHQYVRSIKQGRPHVLFAVTLDNGDKSKYTGHLDNLKGTDLTTYFEIIRKHKLNEINARTDVLISEGWVHTDPDTQTKYTFLSTPQDQRNWIMRAIQMLMGNDLTGATFRAKGATYTFRSNADASAAMFGLLSIEAAVNSGAELKDRVLTLTLAGSPADAANTLNSVVDPR